MLRAASLRVVMAVAPAFVLLSAWPASASQLEVGAGSAFDLGTSDLDLGCADLSVAGIFQGGSGIVERAGDVSIAAGGSLQGQSATLRVGGHWSNTGSFDAGTSAVQLVGDCGLTSGSISGSSTFFELDLTSSIGKRYAFGAGETQTVTDSLTLEGAPGAKLEIRSTVDGTAAFLDLQGAQSVSYVDVKDNHAVGDEIVLEPDSTLSGNTAGWLFASALIAVPALWGPGLALLTFAILWAGWWVLGSSVE